MESSDCGYIVEAFFGFHGITKKALLEYGSNYLPSQRMILGLLDAAGEMNMTKVAQQLAISKETASRTIVQLVEDGLVARSHDDGNRKIVNVSLTRKGKELVKELSQSYNELMWESLSGLTDAERDDLLRASRTAAELLKKAL